MFCDKIDKLPGVADEHIRPVRLLYMPNRDSLEVLCPAAGYFFDNGGQPDGNAWLAPVRAFNPSELAAALNAA
jgi:hypothetical protein